jgi:hypothetical protein
MSSRILKILIILSFGTPVYGQNLNNIWSKTYGTAKNEWGESVVSTSDEGYLLLGTIASNLGFDHDIWLIKCNSFGDTMWTKIYGGSGVDEGYSCLENTNGNYIIAGGTDSFGMGGSDVWIFETNVNGDLLWSKTYGGQDYDGAYSIKKTNDDGYIIAGYTFSFGAGSGDFWILKTDSQGDTVWTKTFGGTERDIAFSIQQTNDGGYIVTGFTESFGVTYEDFWLLKLDINGDTLWTKIFGSIGFERGNSAYETSDSCFIVTGTTSSNLNSYDILLIKFNRDGEILWDKTFGNYSYDSGNCIIQASDGGYVITGIWTNVLFDLLLLKTNKNGVQQWSRTFGGQYNDQGMSVQQTSDGGYIIAGRTDSFGNGLDDVWLIKTDSLGYSNVNSITDKNKLFTDHVLLQNYPNPFNPTTTIKYNLQHSTIVSIQMFNSLGEKIKTLYSGLQTSGSHEIVFDGSSLPSGIYFYQITTKDFSQTKKCLLLK